MVKRACLLLMLLSWAGLFAFAAQQGSDVVYITKSGGSYHRAECRFVKKSRVQISLAEASQKYQPCSVCKPPVFKAGIENEKKPKAKKVAENKVIAQDTLNRNIRFGMPSLAKADPSQREDYLVSRPQFVLSYNDRTRTPNWVCWCLTAKDLGKAKRNESFPPDPLLPSSFLQAKSTAYEGIGFDQGHMCPAADRADCEVNNDPTFFMTNIVPQAPDLNRKTWKRMEDYCRDLARKGNVLHIACGPLGVGGKGSKGETAAIGKIRTVTVPAKCWKVVLVLPHEEAEPRKNTRAIAVIVPNEQGIDLDWSRFRVSVATVEKATGYTFFRNIPAETRAAIVNDVE